MITDHVTFSSARFAIEPGEDAETNPGIYGRALAEWVAENLDRRGVPVLGIKAEDFGRCVMLSTWPYKLWVACASLDGSHARWQMFIGLEVNPIWKLTADGLRDFRRELVERSVPTKAISWGYDTTQVNDPDGNELLFPVPE